MPRLGLKKKEEVGVLLELAIIGVLAFRRIDFLEMPLDFVLLAYR